MIEFRMQYPYSESVASGRGCGLPRQKDVPMLNSIADVPLVILSPEDNVAVARAQIAPGAELGRHGVVAREMVPQGHKIALKPIARGDVVRKYGQVIGYASCDIEAGAHVHTQNVEMRDVALTHDFCVDARPPAYVPEVERATFNGFERAGGRAGTRNYIAVIS